MGPTSFFSIYIYTHHPCSEIGALLFFPPHIYIYPLLKHPHPFFLSSYSILHDVLPFNTEHSRAPFLGGGRPTRFGMLNAASVLNEEEENRGFSIVPYFCPR